MKNLIFVIALVILNYTIIFGQRVIAYDNISKTEFETKLSDTIYVSYGHVIYDANGTNYLNGDFETYFEDKDYYDLPTLKYFINKPYIANISTNRIVQTASGTWEEKIVFVPRIDLYHSHNISEESTILIEDLIRNNKIVAIILNDKGEVIPKDGFEFVRDLNLFGFDREIFNIKDSISSILNR